MINLYERNETDFSHNGIRVLQPIEAIVSEELNGAYSLELTMPRGFSDIEVEQVVKAPTPKNPQLFRVYNTDIDMLGNPVFYCRHIFYDLLDYFIEDTRPTGDGALAISRILDDTPFTGDSDITKQGTAYYQMMNPVNAILGADNSFITVWGGELERDNFAVRMKSQLGADRGVSIRYRKNLTGLRFVTDLSGVATKIMPTGLREDGQTLLKLPEKYVVSPLIDTYYASLYASLSWFNNQLNSSELDRFDKWVAQWNTSCSYKKPYGIWQYTDSGRVDGISGNVDMNIAYTDYPEVIKSNGLNGFTAGTASPSTPESGQGTRTHTIKKGDTLWDISKKYLGTGTRYPEIMSLNALKSTTIYPGQILRIPN